MSAINQSKSVLGVTCQRWFTSPWLEQKVAQDFKSITEGGNGTISLNTPPVGIQTVGVSKSLSTNETCLKRKRPRMLRERNHCNVLLLPQVVLMNQMTTRVKSSQLGQSHLIPALGKPGLS